MVSGFLLLFIQYLLSALSIAIFARVLISWVDPTGGMRVTQILHDVTEPILGPLRKVLPSMGMFDFSPIIAMLLLQVVGQLITRAVAQ